MKITALKTVYWDDGFGIKKGKVKRVFDDHAEVCAENGMNYMVLTSKLSIAPIKKLSSSNTRTIISG